MLYLTILEKNSDSFIQTAILSASFSLNFSNHYILLRKLIAYSIIHCANCFICSVECFIDIQIACNIIVAQLWNS